jgi:two-component system sensor histidine kinase QseC
MTTVWFSLRRRLLTLLLGGVTAAWMVSMVWSYVDVSHEVEDLFDAQLVQATQTLLALNSENEDNDVEDLGEETRKYQRRLSFQIWRADGELVLHSRNTPESPLTTTAGLSESGTPEGGHWRYFSQWDKARNYQVQVSENHRVRDELVRQIALRLLVPALLGLPLIGLWVWLATRHGLNSLHTIAQQILRRDPQQLQAVVPATAPEEIRSMLEAINSLFGRVEAALEAERRFTADAAHELRTPLAALQTQLQVALRARDDAERDNSLAQLQRGLSRASHLVDQMLQLARLDPESGMPSPEPVDVSMLAESVCADLGGSILEKNLDFELLAEPACVVMAQGEWLRVLIRNLVDNAVRYTPASGIVRVRVAKNDGVCQLIVSDSGPGIPPEERKRVVRRFHRLNPSEQPGSGLGLAIVERIANLHGTSLRLEAGEGGVGLHACVELRLFDSCA